MARINRLELQFDSASANALRFSAGCVAGAIATTATYPLDVIRTRITASLGNDGEIQRPDIRRLYSGLSPTLFAMSLFVGAQQASYDFLRLYATSNCGLAPSVNLFVGCSVCSGVLAQSAVYPLDVIRRRMQIGDQSVLGPRSDVVAHRTWFALRNVVQLHGFRSLFAGIMPTYLKVIPSVAVSVTVRDILLGRLEQT